MACSRLVGVIGARSSRSAPSLRSMVMRASVREPGGGSNGQSCRPATAGPLTTIYANGAKCGENDDRDPEARHNHTAERQLSVGV